MIPLLAAVLVFLLSGCGAFGRNDGPGDRFDVGSFGLSGLSLDGKALELGAVYPSGAGLYLSSNGEAVLVLGDRSCTADWSSDNDSFTLTFADLTGKGSFSGDTVTFELEGTGMTYEFSAGEAAPDPALDYGSMDGLNPGTAGLRSSGTEAWTGRFWFENPEGEWTDYEYRSLEIDAEVSGLLPAGTASEPELNGESETGRIVLYNRFYSETEPFAEIEFRTENGQYRCADGYVMSYPVHEYGMKIELTEDLMSNLRDTVIIEKPGDYGHVFTAEKPEYPDGEEPAVPVLRLSGNCRDALGGFDYVMELTEETDASGM